MTYNLFGGMLILLGLPPMSLFVSASAISCLERVVLCDEWETKLYLCVFTCSVISCVHSFMLL